MSDQALKRSAHQPVLTAEHLIAKAAPLKGCPYHVPGYPAGCVDCAEVHAEYLKALALRESQEQL